MLKKALFAATALFALAGVSHAADLKEFRVGILGGENETDRLRNYACLADHLKQEFGFEKVSLFPAADYYTEVVSLDFEDYPFEIQRFGKPCALCGAEEVYLDEVILDDKGGRMFVCSDTDHCEDRREHGHVGEMLAPKEAAE